MFQCSLVFGLGSGGFRNEIVDGEAAGKGYCFTAQADGPSAVHYNPAGLTQLNGDYFSLGYAMQMPRVEVKHVATTSTVEMQKQDFLIPNLYYVSDLNSDKWRIGFSATSPYGLSTDWASDSFAANYMTESDLEMLNFNPCVAYKVNDSLSIGGGVNYFVQHMSKHKILTAAASTGGDFQLKGSDEGYGYNLGLLYTPLEDHRVGLSYRSKIDLTTVGTVTLDTLNAAYTALFGGSAYTTAMESKSTIPRSLALGYAYKPNEKWVVELDMEWTDWACVESELVTYPNEGVANRLAVLNNGNPVSRDWNDVMAYGFGAEYKSTDKLDLRFGGFYHQTPVPSHSVDTALPDADKHGITMGLGYEFEDVILDLSYCFMRYRNRDVTNTIGASTGSDLNGLYRGHVNIFAVAFTYKY